MNKFFITAFFAVSALFTDAQVQGTIHYSETRKLHINIQGDMPPPPDLPTEHTMYTLLYFTKDASLYQNDPSVESDAMRMEEEESGGERMIMHMAPPDNKLYSDFNTKKIVRQEDFMQRKFLITTDLESKGWKMTGKQKMILNYPCMEAIKEDSLQTVSAWFTSMIPVSSGPAEYIGLPGMVLEVNINNGDVIITATSVSGEVDPDDIVAPQEGKKVTEEEFNAIVDEKMKEMGIDRNGGPNVIIKIEDN